MKSIGVDACRKGWFALKRFMRKDLAGDDILDAIVLAVTAKAKAG